MKSEIVQWLHTLGYNGKVIKKPHDDRDDGPATFYLADRFDLVETFDLPYAYKNKAQFGSGLYQKGNCCLITALRPKK